MGGSIWASARHRMFGTRMLRVREPAAQGKEANERVGAW